MASPQTKWFIADAVLRGIMVPPTIAMFVVTCCYARRRNDPARVAFSYLKAIFPFFIFWMFCFVVADIVATVRVTLEQSANFDYYDDSNTDNLLSNITVRFNFVGGLSQEVADILTIICLVELGNGFLFCLKQSRTGFQTVLRFLAIAVGVVTFVLIIAWFGIWNAQYTNYFNSLGNSNSDTQFDTASFNHEIAIGNDLDIAGDVILLAAALASVFYAGYVLHQCWSATTMKNSAVLFVVATILNLLRHCWLIAIDSWNLNNVSPPMADFYVVDPIINVWADFVLLVLIFIIGRRKQGGLWSTPQPWIQQGPIQQPQPQMMAFQGQSNWQQPPPQQPFVYAAPAYAVPAPAGLQGWQQGQVLVYSQPLATEATETTNGHVHVMK